MRPRASWLVACLVAAGCGGAAPEVEPIQTGPLTATPTGSDDVQIATVNGKPVWGSCVSAQSSRHHLSRDAAVRECIDFELLAQAAAAHDASDPDGQMKTAVVSKLVELGFEDAYSKPADLGSFLDKVIDRNLWRMHRPEYRSSTYVRVIVPDGPGGGTDVETRARSVADAIETELGTHATGLFPRHVEDAAHHIADAQHVVMEPATDVLPKDMRIVWEERPPAEIRQLDATYGKALFAIHEVGEMSPPIRTKWGWDIILWTGGITAREITRDELVAEMFPDIRRAYFTKWVAELARDRGIKINVDNDVVARLDDQGSAAGSDAPAPPAPQTKLPGSGAP